jgi:poly-gamma-glutamate synthesis protein (capsule biosynthesis protein)
LRQIFPHLAVLWAVARWTATLGAGLLLAAGCRPAETGGERVTVPREVRLAAVGDVLLDRGVARAMRRHGAAYPFKRVRSILQNADLTFFNMEGCLSRRGVARRTDVAFRADPALAGQLKKAGFTIAGLANNHTLDYGRGALRDTITALHRAGIVTVGAGETLEAAARLRVVQKKGLKVGFLAFTDVPNGGFLPLPAQAGVAGADLQTLALRVGEAKKRCDTLVVSFHWGVEYMKTPTRRQERLARRAVDHGAHLVLGHHPHVLQPVRIYKGAPIAYSLGGFVWDSHIRGADQSEILIFRLTAAQAVLQKRIPVTIRGGQPQPVNISGPGYRIKKTPAAL